MSGQLECYGSQEERKCQDCRPDPNNMEPLRAIDLPFQFLGGALSCQASVALLIGTVPITLITIQVSMATTPAHRNQKPGVPPPEP